MIISFLPCADCNKLTIIDKMYMYKKHMYCEECAIKYKQQTEQSNKEKAEMEMFKNETNK